MALISAIKSSETAQVISLLEQGADPNSIAEVDRWGFGAQPTSALMLAMTWFCRRETAGFDSTVTFNEHLVRALVEGGASLKKASPFAETPLYQAVSFGVLIPRRYELVEYLLDRGADINEIVCGCYTALHPACYGIADGDKEIVLLLLDRGAHVNPNTAYRSPLMIAVKAKALDIVAILLARGADVHHRTRNGETALSLAQGKRGVSVQIRRMLEAAGAQPDLLDAECKQYIKSVEQTDVLDAEIVDRWAELWRENLEGNKFDLSHLHHAQLLCRLGSLIALHQDDYPGAIGLIERLLKHPKAKQLVEAELLDLYGEKLYYLLLAGDESRAIMLARILMTGNADNRRVKVCFAIGTIGEALEDFFENAVEQQDLVSRELTDLAWDISQLLRKHPLKRRRLAGQATPQELYTLLRRKG